MPSAKRPRRSQFPFRVIEENLKQLSMADASAAERVLFATLFPRFYDESDFSWNDSEETRELQRAFASPKVVFVQPKLPRRFGGYALPRRRYYTVCSDEVGDDHQALANELRAYRDPVRTGMVEVVDCGGGAGVLAAGDRTFPLAKGSYLATIIHEPWRVESELAQVPHDRFESGDGKTFVIVRFAYRLQRTAFSKAIDLRDAVTRDWFAGYFSHSNPDWIWPEEMKPAPAEPPLTIRSLYGRSTGRTPRPETFPQMLPTVVNPVRGGGDSAWGGTTLMAIGEHLRNHGTDALIFPAARSDTFVIYEDGVRRQYGGWNLVDYRHAGTEHRAHFVVLDHSPWSWVDMPGITVRAASDGPHAGTLILEGVVAESSRTYRADVACARAAETETGTWSKHMHPLEALALGTYGLRWIHLAFAQAPVDDVEKAFEIGCGLLLRRDLEHLVAGLRESHARVAATGDGNAAFDDALRIACEAQHAIGPVEGFGDLVGAAIDLELILLVLTRLTKAGYTQLNKPLGGKDLAMLQVPPTLRSEIDSLLALVRTQGSDVKGCALATVALSKHLTEHVRRTR